MLARLIVKYAAAIALLGTLSAVVAGYYSVQLYKNLRTDIEELLPTTSRSVLDLEEVSRRLESIDNIVLLTFSKDTKASKRFVTDLASALEKLPKTVVASVEFKIDNELRFFKERRSLYISVEDLTQIRDYIRKRLDYETALYNPLNIFSGVNIPEPVFNFQTMRHKYEQRTSDFDHFPGGYYATPDEKIRALISNMPGKGLESAQRMKTALEKTVAELNPKSYAPDLEVKYTGNGENMLEESAALVADLELSTALCTGLVALAMLLFYRSFWATTTLVVSLLMGTFWTFGISFFAVGYLNANTAFLASIVIGNGINFGVIFLARYLEERRMGADNLQAVDRSIQGTFAPTLTAALAAGLSYGSLMLTGFRGFSQFGVIGLIGMILCWLSSITLMPAFLTLLDRLKALRWKEDQGEPDSPLLAVLANVIEQFPGTLCLLSLVGVVLTLLVSGNYKLGLIETDLSKLRDRQSMSHGSGALYHYIDDIFKHSFSPMVVLPKDREHSRQIAELFRKEKDREGKDSPITVVQTLDDFVPRDQDKKIALLRDIKSILPKRLVKRLPPREQKLAAELLDPNSFVPFTEKDLPKMVLEKFREKDGSIGKMVLVDKAFQKDGGDDANALIQFVETGRRITDSVAPGSPVAGSIPISYDMFKSIVNDGPKATFVAFLSVVILVILMFRNFKTIALVLFALGLGVTWLAGLILGFHLKINFLNFIALPITFGIGVDYGVNVFSRYREEGPGKIIKVIRDTGGAVLLCSLTTIIGYSSLLLAGNQAFVSFGQLAVFGELTCVLAAVISLPALLCFFERFRKPLVTSSPSSAPTSTSLLIVLIAAASFLPRSASAHYPIDQKIPEGKPSIFSDKIPKWLKSWPPKGFPEWSIPKKDVSPVWIRAIKVPGNDTYIGIAKSTTIQTPLSRVEFFLTHFETYRDRSADLKEIKVLSTESNKIKTAWEIESPVFFVANTRYEQVYLVEHSSPTRTLIRYQLKEGNNLNFSDGVIVLEAVGQKNEGTRLTGLDFFDAKWGPLAAIALGKIWQKSLEGYYRGDISLKIQAENPNFKAEQIEKETHRIFEQFPMGDVQYLESFSLE